MQKKMKDQQIIVLVIAVGVAVILGGSIATKVLATQAETYEKLKILSEVLYLIQTNYVEEVDTQEVVYGAIHGMLKVLDPHSSFMPPDMYQEMQVETRGNFGGLGIQIGIKDNQLTVIAPIDDTPAFRAGIEAGDKILRIEEQSTNDMTLMEAVKLLRGPKGSQVTITIMRDSFEKPREFTLVRDIIEIKSVSYRMLVQNIGYLRLRQFQEDSANEMEDALRDLEENGMEALILDLRSNPGGLLNSAVEIADKFLEKGKLIVYTEGRKKNQDMRFVAHQEFTHPNYPMVVLVDHGSASASEIVAGALQANSRAVIIGTQTYGKGSVQSVIPLSDNSGLRLTTALYYTPDGKSIHEKGITPDIVIAFEPPTKEVSEDAQPEASQDETSPPKEEGEETPEAKNPEEEAEQMLMRDVQLQRAVDVLRGILIFEKQSV
ncbi:periplasmic carboxy-terminal processing protease lipoprotein [Candidatus Vecturithrix granuli]|uniref:Periplasmic carboxy-terminal processing protease lipoprotein n=1 Tax=Vecturithrix granuli TaxID=1499967 RepID=A0A081BU26_VECG1|nr:periplasmic carboxy-terminal processing protease lipoprotein [Candidatus Vecturithrix granuli]